ncbi:MAG TPA: hypothetical protein VGE91_06685 [Solirubrobacterales bacterium]|jgi:hypothetical protein
MRRRRLALGAALALSLSVAGLGDASYAQTGPTAAITQPPQPKKGPGGRSHPNRGFRVSAGGSGDDAWFAFEPTRPRPRKAPVAIVMHGYGEFAGYDQMYAFISHTVRRGSVVIYPRWQTGLVSPCPGPFNIEPCIASAVSGIDGALSYLRSSRKRVHPQLRKASYFGFSFGGIVTANMANRWRSLGLPRPRAIFLDDPHDGGFSRADESALDDSLGGIPRNVKFECHSGAEGAISTPPTALGGGGESCNAVFRLIPQIPNRNKDLVLTHTDSHGEPVLSSHHGVCAGGAAPFGPADAYDWNFCWKVWDALRSCAYSGKNCRYALGNTPEHRSLGRWSDGTPVIPLKIQNAPPIGP